MLHGNCLILLTCPLQLLAKRLSGIVAGLSMALASIGASPAWAQSRLEVVASFSVLADITREIGGERISLRSLVGPDSDVHVYQPTPADGRSLNRAGVLIVNGLSLEGWTARLIDASGFKGKLVTASDGAQLMLSDAVDPNARSANKRKPIPDPHAWQSLRNGMIYVDNIVAGLSAADPGGAGYYRDRGAAYKKQLAELDAWVRAEIASVPQDQRKVITTHDAFQYFGSAYGVRFIAAEGLSTDSDPTAQHIAMLIAQVRKEHVRALFIENMSDPRLLEQIARDGGAVLGGELYADALSNPTGPAGSYLDMFRHNVRQLKAGMLKN